MRKIQDTLICEDLSLKDGMRQIELTFRPVKGGNRVQYRYNIPPVVTRDMIDDERLEYLLEVAGQKDISREKVRSPFKSGVFTTAAKETIAKGVCDMLCPGWDMTFQSIKDVLSKFR